MSALTVSCVGGSPGSPGGASPCPGFPCEDPGSDTAEDSGSRAEGRDSQAPCLLHGPALRLASSSLISSPALHPGRNVSRSCTDKGWTPLEPGPYPTACGSDDNESNLDSNLDEVGLSAPHPPPECLGLPGSFHSFPLRGGGYHLCGSQDSWGLPSPCLLPLQACISKGSSPGCPSHEGTFMRMTHSNKS